VRVRCAYVLSENRTGYTLKITYEARNEETAISYFSSPCIPLPPSLQFLGEIGSCVFSLDRFIQQLLPAAIRVEQFPGIYLFLLP
jgi:hypothetical protein